MCVCAHKCTGRLADFFLLLTSKTSWTKWFASFNSFSAEKKITDARDAIHYTHTQTHTHKHTNTSTIHLHVLHDSSRLSLMLMGL